MLPELVMVPPKYLATDIANNDWMKDIPPEYRTINTDIAMQQFFNLYSLVSQQAIVWLLPPKKGLQDQVYCTNAGVVLPHLDKTCILSKFKAEGRTGEEKELEKFLKEMDYDTYQCPYYFEGEAELKWVRDNLYIGGYGIRTSKKALNWISTNFDAKIIEVEMTDPYLYHLDCLVFPLDSNTAIIADIIPDKTKEIINKYINKVYWVDSDLAYVGITNNIKLGFNIFNADNSTIFSPDMPPPFGMTREESNDAYLLEKRKNDMLTKICSECGFEPVFVSLTEFMKSGAALSCMFLHLKRGDQN